MSQRYNYVDIKIVMTSQKCFKIRHLSDHRLRATPNPIIKTPSHDEFGGIGTRISKIVRFGLLGTGKSIGLEFWRAHWASRSRQSRDDHRFHTA